VVISEALIEQAEEEASGMLWPSAWES